MKAMLTYETTATSNHVGQANHGTIGPEYPRLRSVGVNLGEAEEKGEVLR